MNAFLMVFALMRGFSVQDTPPLPQMLDRIGSNIQELQNNLPDITCTEKLTLTSRRSSRLGSYSHEALITTVRVSSRGASYLTVSRQITSAKGTPPGVINRIQNLLYDITLVFGPRIVAPPITNLAGLKIFVAFPRM
jgi:hypothetical protein